MRKGDIVAIDKVVGFVISLLAVCVCYLNLFLYFSAFDSFYLYHLIMSASSFFPVY